MKIRDYDFELPEGLIADYPVAQRDCSRLLVLDRNSKSTDHRQFYEVADYLQRGDILVLNNSKVYPARLFGQKHSGGKVQVLLNREIKNGLWEVVGKGLKVGVEIVFDGGALVGKVMQKENDTYQIDFNLRGNDFFQEVEKIGQIPLPPYIEKKRLNGKLVDFDDKSSYQTVYAKETGSVAAPTAGLHFTPALLEKLRRKGIKILEITLHVGLGTFQPIKTENIEDHEIHSESYEIKASVLKEILAAKANKRKVFAVGTTSTRVLEHLFSCEEKGIKRLVEAEEDEMILSGQTRIYIYPGYRFRCVDAMITNFHLPKSSLMLLVSAFADRDLMMKTYQEAIERKYRFYSYGDAMIIL